MFRKLGVQDVAGYKRGQGGGHASRCRAPCCIIDEFQEFFVEDDAIAQTASLLFDRIVRQGRAFGIHVLLGSQTLGGAYTLARATLGQMVIRVALQCNEADAYLIMDDNNSAPRLLSRPGEGIYNDAAGARRGQQPLPGGLAAGRRARPLARQRSTTLAAQQDAHYPSPDRLRRQRPRRRRARTICSQRAARHRRRSASAAGRPRCWLGAPNSIKGPDRSRLPAAERQQSPHRRPARGSGAHHARRFRCSRSPRSTRAGGARFVLFQSAAPGSAEARIARADRRRRRRNA